MSVVNWEDNPDYRQMPAVEGHWNHVNFWDWPIGVPRDYYIALAIKEEYESDKWFEDHQKFDAGVDEVPDFYAISFDAVFMFLKDNHQEDE